MRFGVVARRHRNKVAAIEAHARDMTRRNSEHRIKRAVWSEPHDATCAVVGDPETAVDVEGEAIGLTTWTQRPVAAVCDRRAVGVQVVHDHAMATCVGMEKCGAVGRDRHAIALLHVAVKHRGGAVEVDAPQLAGHRRCRGVERSVTNSADIDTTCCVGAEVVHSEGAIEGSDDSIGAVANMHEVAPTYHVPAIGMLGDAADTASFRHDCLGCTIAPQPVDASVEHVAEHERAVGVDRRTFPFG